MRSLTSTNAVLTEITRGFQHWAKGAVVTSDMSSDGDFVVVVANGKFGNERRYAPFIVRAEELQSLGLVDIWGRLASDLRQALSMLGYSPLKRTTRWCVDRNGRRRWQVGIAMRGAT